MLLRSNYIIQEKILLYKLYLIKYPLIQLNIFTDHYDEEKEK